MNYTEKLHLNKPEKAEQYNLDHWNDNSDTIDAYATQETTERQEADTLLQQGVNQAKQFSNMQGTAAISQGGTGETTAQAALNALHGSVQTQNAIDTNDEVTFIKRTPADAQQGTPETIDVKDVTVETLANKVFALLKANNANLFGANDNGFVPKAGSASANSFLNAQGSWLNPSYSETLINVTASESYTINENTILKITASAAVTVVLANPTLVGTTVTIINGSDTLTHSLSTTNVEGSTVDSILPNSYCKIAWNGSAWVNITAPAVGSTFVRYPAQNSPDEVYPCSKWSDISSSYAGAFFRAAGGNAQAFANQTNYQSDATAVKGLSVDNKDLSHTHTHGYNATSGSPQLFAAGGYSFIGVNNLTVATATTAATITMNHDHSLSSSDAETRPINYTVQIWKRIA